MREKERERESKRGIPETITSLNGLDLSPASSFFFFPLLLPPPPALIPIHRFVPVNRGEREKERKKVDTKLDTKVALLAYTSRLIFFLASTRDCWKK